VASDILTEEHAEFGAAHPYVVRSAVRLEVLSSGQGPDDDRIEAGGADQIGGDSKRVGIVAGKRNADAITLTTRFVLERFVA
jgi:hypothetical protein